MSRGGVSIHFICHTEMTKTAIQCMLINVILHLLFLPHKTGVTMGFFYFIRNYFYFKNY